MYSVAMAFKMTEQVEQWICIKFCIKLEHSSMENFWMIKGCRYGQLVIWQLRHYNMPAHASCLVQSFLVKHQIIQVTQPPSRLDLAFLQTKITFEREEISDC